MLILGLIYAITNTASNALHTTEIPWSIIDALLPQINLAARPMIQMEKH